MRILPRLASACATTPSPAPAVTGTETAVIPEGVKLAQVDSVTASCNKVPIPPHCLKPPTGEEMILPPRPNPPLPRPAPTAQTATSPQVPTARWYHRLVPWFGAGVRDSNPPEVTAPTSTTGPALEPLPEPRRARVGPDAVGSQESPDLDAAKKKQPKDGPKEKPRKEPNLDPNRILPDVSNYPPGKRPCLLVAVRGNAVGLPPGIRGEIKCEYNCGGKRELRFAWGTAGDAWDVCEKLMPTW